MPYLFFYQLYSFLNSALFYSLLLLNLVFLNCGGPTLIPGAVSKDVKKGGVPVTALAISHDAQYLLSGHDNGTVVLWNLKESKAQEIHEDLSSAIYTVDINSEFGNIIASADQEGNLIVKEIGGETVFRHSQQKQYPIFALNIGLGGKRIYCGADDSLGYVFDVDSGKLMKYLYQKGTSDASVFCSDLSLNNRYFATGHQDGTFKLWDARDLSLIDEEKHDDYPIVAIDFSSDGDFLVIGNSNGNIFLYSIDQKKIIRQKKSKPMSSISFGPKNKTLISSHDDKRIRFWKIDRETNPIKYIDSSPKIHAQYISHVIVYKKLIITSSLDGYIKIFDMNYNEKASLSITKHDDWIIINSDGYYNGKGSSLNKYDPNKQKESVLNNLF